MNIFHFNILNNHSYSNWDIFQIVIYNRPITVPTDLSIWCTNDYNCLHNLYIYWTYYKVSKDQYTRFCLIMDFYNWCPGTKCTNAVFQFTICHRPNQKTITSWMVQYTNRRWARLYSMKHTEWTSMIQRFTHMIP